MQEASAAFPLSVRGEEGGRTERFSRMDRVCKEQNTYRLAWESVRLGWEIAHGAIMERASQEHLSKCLGAKRHGQWS